MASVDYNQALGVCSKCGMMKIQENDVVKCIVCDAPKPTSSLVNNVADPGEEAIQKLLKGQRIVLPTQHAETSSKQVVVQHVSPNTLIGSLEQMQILLNTIALPDSMKQVKKLLKVKQIINELVEEING